jgi:hypothetical protein
MIHSLAGASVVVPDLDAAISAYGDYLGYRGDAPAPIGDERATAWGAPQAATARMAELRPASGERRFIRLIEGAPAPGFAPFRTLGWTAIEIVVQDLARLADTLADSPFQIVGPPAVLDFDFTDRISAMQVVGPGGEVLYLTQIDGEVPGFELPAAHSPVGQLFIMVLGARVLDEGAAPYVARGRAAGPRIDARIDVLSAAYGLPQDRRHALTTVALEERSFLEIDAFPASATARPKSAVGLPSGITMVSFNVGAESETGMVQGSVGEWIEYIR